ncbi:DUF2130 domain-containing protein [Pinibacter soli]|uniref:DUF2130 domain-containing protein n=1 Tax=Pinibacter soli TaxID=3044211 RepID=A0ABT6RHJ2_9BACT|nr:DUF2130 domain-containing protein [Pinibacter soli]MDI3322046.1 DUF2130 domain-containing protein [Pinibacter soli]
MPTQIKCTNCGHEFPLEDALNDELKEAIEKEKQELRQQVIDYKKTKDEELKRKDEEFSVIRRKQEEEFAANARRQEEKFQLQLETEIKKKNQQLEENLRKSITADYEGKLEFLELNNKENEEKLKEARKKEIEFLQKEKELQNKEAELELSLQRKLQEERSKLSEEIRQIEEQKNAAKETEFNLRLKELEKQLEDQKKLAEEMRRKAEQGSMQLQGEVQELALEEMLRASFPFDVVSEVGKGVRGADCILTVRNNFGQECGKIIFESKRAENFGGEWVEKLKNDMRSQQADIAVLVTKKMPKDMDKFGDISGVWVCSFAEVKPLVHVLRDGLVKIATATKFQENRGDKMHLLYNYLTSHEFAEQWNAIREGFMSMRISIQKERDAMEKLWKAREKQLEKVLLNAAHIRGSIEGIAGQDSIDLNLLDDAGSDLLN